MMSPEQKAAYVMAQAAVLNAKVAGMLTNNAYWLSIGQSPAYGESDFTLLIKESNCGHNDVMTLFNEG